MKMFLFASTLFLISASLFAQSATYVYDLRYKEASVVTTAQVGKITNVFGKRFDLDVDAFAGLTLITKKPVSGFLIGKRIALADNAEGYFGGGLNLPAGKNPSVVFGAGVGWKF